MKQLSLRMLTAILTICVSMSAFAGQDEKNGKAYLTIAELPNMVNFLPPPPEFESSLFVADQVRYLWGKKQRQDEERAQMAIRDAVYGMNTIIEEFQGIFGLEITKEDTPEIYTIIQDVASNCDSIVNPAKQKYMRWRPFMYYDESTLVPEQEEEHRTNGSYPSGHTNLGWTMGLLLSDINPAAADQLLQRAYEYGQSRVIAGYHWQSDVDAGRLAASVLYVKIKSHPRFIEQLEKAKAEFAEKTNPTAVRNVTRSQEGSARVYQIDGTPATESSRGILIQNNQKFIRK